MIDRRPTVLLIEHDPALRDLEEMVLSEAGYQVEKLPEGGNPVSVARRTAPNVVVVAIRYNQPEDWRDVDQLRNDPRTRGIPLVVISTSQRTAALAAASTNVSETVVAPYDITALESAVASALGKAPAAAALPAAAHTVPAYLVIAADTIQQASRAVVLRAVGTLLRSEPYRSAFQGLTPELVDNLGLLVGAIVEGLQRDLPAEQVFTTPSVQKTIRAHVQRRKQQGVTLENVIREAQTLENQIDRTIEGLVGASFSTSDALVVVEKIRVLIQTLILLDVENYAQV